MLVQYCLAQETTDDMMWRTVERKLQVTSSSLNGRSAAESFTHDHAAESAPPRAAPAAVGGGAAPSSGSGDIRAMLSQSGGRREREEPDEAPQAAANKRPCAASTHEVITIE